MLREHALTKQKYYCRWGCLAVARMALIAAILSMCAVAEGQISVSPLILDDITVFPGSVKTIFLVVGSTAGSDQDCVVSVSGMRIAEGGLPSPADDAPRSCADWITVNPAAFTLSPGESKRIVLQVRVPKDTVGGYYALISCTATGQEAGDAEGEGRVQAGIRFRHRNLVPLLLAVPGSNMQAIIDGAAPTFSKAPDGDGYTIQLPLRNRGNTHARITGSFEISTESGQSLEKFEMGSGRGLLLPEHERLFESKSNVNLADGVYRAQVRLDLDKSSRPMEKAFSFYVEKGQPRVAEISDELRTKLTSQSSGFIVTPSQITMASRPGGRRTEALEVVNLTENELTLIARTGEWLRTSSNTDLIPDGAPAHKRSGLNFLTLRQPEVVLPPNGRRRVPLLASIPSNATGEVYAALYFDRQDRELDQTPQARIRRGAMVRIQAEGTGQRDAELAAFEANRDTKGATIFTVQYRNTGDLSFTPEAVFIIRKEGSNETVESIRAKIPVSYIQAGGEGVLKEEWAKVVDPGKYTAELTFRFDSNKPPLVKRTDFVVQKAGESPVTTSAESKK